MTAQIMEFRWIAPPSSNVHPRLALVRHEGRLFSYSELLSRTPFEYVGSSLEACETTPQEWWDDLLRRAPDVAQRAASECHCQDFDILDLYEVPAKGTA